MGIGRTISSVIASLLLVAGVYFLIWAHHQRQEFQRWTTAKPIDMAVDVSHPGHFSGEFRQTCQTSHGEAVCLEMPSNLLASASASNVLASLQFDCTIADAQGTQVVKSSFDGDRLDGDRLIDGAIPVVFIAPFKKGIYTLTLTVSKGAPALAGVHQRLVARYELCGLEMMPASMATVMGVAAIVIAGIILLVVLVITKLKRPEGRD